MVSASRICHVYHQQPFFYTENDHTDDIVVVQLLLNFAQLILKYSIVILIVMYYCIDGSNDLHLPLGDLDKLRAVGALKKTAANILALCFLQMNLSILHV